jgi:hypothetical protein
MFFLLPIVVALAAAEPAPAPSSLARPTPLTEIGRVRALPACVPIVAHANGAITQALENDRTLAIMTTNLHNTDFDKLNFIQRRNAIEAMMKQAEEIRKASKMGDAEVKRLREYAVNSPDPQRKEELKTFADALGGAIFRQQKAATEFMRDITIMRGREDAVEARDLMDKANQTPPNAVARTSGGQQMIPYPTPTPNPMYNRQMKYIGDTLEDMVKVIQSDEGRAADHSIAATSGC